MRRKGCGEAGDRQYEAITLQRCRKELQGTQALRVEAGLVVDRGGNSGSEVRSWGLAWKACDNHGQRKQPRNREWGRGPRRKLEKVLRRVRDQWRHPQHIR